MKLNVDVILKRSYEGVFAAGQKLKVSIDVDAQHADFDDAIQLIEAELYEQHGILMFNEVDFTIANAEDICEELNITENV